MSCSLNSLNGGYTGDYIGDIKGDPRSLDYSSYRDLKGIMRSLPGFFLLA